MSPNVENITAWVQALRSGEYVQGFGALKRRPPNGPVQYCCLGVACEMAVRAGVDVRVTDLETGFTQFGGRGDYLPPQVARWLGLDDGDSSTAVVEEGQLEAVSPRVTDPHGTSLGSSLSLASLNDANNWDFPRIAGVIEREWLS